MHSSVRDALLKHINAFLKHHPKSPCLGAMEKNVGNAFRLMFPEIPSTIQHLEAYKWSLHMFLKYHYDMKHA